MLVTGASYSIWFSLWFFFIVSFFKLFVSLIWKCFIQEINEQEAIFIPHSLSLFCHLLQNFVTCIAIVCATHQQDSYPSTIKLRTNDKHVRYGKQLNLILRQSNLMSFNLTWINCLSSRFCVLSFFFFFFQQTKWQKFSSMELY